MNEELLSMECTRRDHVAHSRSAVVNVWAGVETAYRGQAIARNRAAFDALRTALARRLANAANVVNR